MRKAEMRGVASHWDGQLEGESGRFAVPRTAGLKTPYGVVVVVPAREQAARGAEAKRRLRAAAMSVP